MSKCNAIKNNGDGCSYNSLVGSDMCGVHIDKVNCITCFDNIKLSDRFNLECGHIFHRDCIRRWMKVNPTCPICRQNIPIDPSDTEILDALEKKRKDLESQQLEDDEELARIIQEEEEEEYPESEIVYLVDPNRLLFDLIYNIDDDIMGLLFDSIPWSRRAVGSSNVTSI